MDESNRIEYIRKNGGNKGHKKGVLYCGVNPNNPQGVVVGFTLCNNIDRFDYIGEKHMKGFGANTAKIRAEKWSEHTDYFIQNTFSEFMLDSDCPLLAIINPDTEKVVEIPPSVVGRMNTFLARCRRYYKDKVFPVWVQAFEKKDEYPSEKLEVSNVRGLYISEF